jgi:hypothetical protein
MRRGSDGYPWLARILEAAADPDRQSPTVVAGSGGRGASRVSLQASGAGGGAGVGPLGSSDATILICTLLPASGIAR